MEFFPQIYGFHVFRKLQEQTKIPQDSNDALYIQMQTLNSALLKAELAPNLFHVKDKNMLYTPTVPNFPFGISPMCIN